MTNAWVRNLSIQVSIEPLAPQEQRTTLGDVCAGQSVILTDALPQQEQYVIHGRYDDNRLEFDTGLSYSRVIGAHELGDRVPRHTEYVPSVLTFAR